MRIQSVRVRNYKSFRESPVLDLAPGFNVIVGQNNVGKTALLEALSLTITEIPHRSAITAPDADAPDLQGSESEISFVLAPGEAISLLSQETDFFLPVAAPSGHSPAVDAFKLYLGGEVRAHGTWRASNGGFVTAQFTDFAVGGPTQTARLSVDRATRELRVMEGNYGGVGLQQTVAYALLNRARARLYGFTAERLNLAHSSVASVSQLQPNAANLAQVLNYMSSRDPMGFVELNELVTEVFPTVRQITAPPDNQTAHIRVWPVDPATRRDDLAVSLGQSGTGIGQVLAILYVVLTAKHGQTIIIDEPQSFLHPGAVRKLFAILRGHSQHQFIVTTHSPVALFAAQPETILFVQRSSAESSVHVVDAEETTELASLLSDLGARLSDAFGADSVLWVEGRTEEACFPIILERLSSYRLRGTVVLGVHRTGDFDGGKSDWAYDVYSRLVQGPALLPPAVAFIFDRERRSEEAMHDLRGRSRGLVHFLPRRMYENYLLYPPAIAAVLNYADTSELTIASPEAVEALISVYRQERRYLKGHTPATLDTIDDLSWERYCDAASVLHDVFATLSDQRVAFRKTEHSLALTEWVLTNDPAALVELVEFLLSVVNHSKRGEPVHLRKEVT
jgi:energy-coupling factor transporter ATP-binding protein EcfA2